MAIIIEKEIKVILTGKDVDDLSLLCKAQKEDAQTRLTSIQLADARAFAARINCTELWHLKNNYEKNT